MYFAPNEAKEDQEQQAIDSASENIVSSLGFRKFVQEEG